jgi:hypothetical protein
VTVLTNVLLRDIVISHLKNKKDKIKRPIEMGQARQAWGFSV